MKRGRVGRFGLAVIAGATLGLATGCSSTAVSMAGWGPAPPNTGPPVAAQQGAPRFAPPTGMKLTDKEEAAKAPSWLRVQDCPAEPTYTPNPYPSPAGTVSPPPPPP